MKGLKTVLTLYKRPKNTIDPIQTPKNTTDSRKTPKNSTEPPCRSYAELLRATLPLALGHATSAVGEEELRGDDEGAPEDDGDSSLIYEDAE